MSVVTHRGALVFCGRCCSGLVDVRFWQTEVTAVFRCTGCGHESVVEGFTIGRAYDLPAVVMRDARADMASPRALMMRAPTRSA